jgi:O-antigen/teichoic acid export membrane protein
MLKARAMAAASWSGIDILFRQFLQFAVAIVLARLVSPEEFGILALLSLFMGIAAAFIDSGFSAALIQRQDLTPTDESTVFWLNLSMGGVAALALSASAHLVADLFAQPALVLLAYLMALNIWMSAAGAIHGTLLTKTLNARTQLKVGVLATAGAGVVAVAMALRGYGIWALAAQTVVATCLSTALLWYYHPWRPLLTFSWASAVRLFGFGGYMFASGLLDTLYSRAYTLVIGKFHGVSELGFYNRADSMKQLPVGVLTALLGRVALPVFSEVAHDRARLRRGVQLSLRCLMLVNVPMMLGLAALANPLVRTLLGAQWAPAVPLLQILCIAGVFWPLHVVNLNALMAQGRSHLFFRIEVAKKLIGLGMLMLGAFWGVWGIAWSQAVLGGVAFAINAHYTERLLGYGGWAQCRDVAPIAGISLVTALATHWLSMSLECSDWLNLLVSATGGVALYLTLVSLSRLSAYTDAIALALHGTSWSQSLVKT